MTVPRSWEMTESKMVRMTPCRMKVEKSFVATISQLKVPRTVTTCTKKLMICWKKLMIGFDESIALLNQPKPLASGTREVFYYTVRLASCGEQALRQPTLLVVATMFPTLYCTVLLLASQSPACAMAWYSAGVPWR